MIVRITQRLPFPPEQAYSWCTDFQDSDPQLSRARLRTRHVLRRTAKVVEMEETGVMGFRYAASFRVDLKPPNGWIAVGRSNMGTSHNTYWIHSDGEGSMLDITFDIHLRGPYRLMAPFARGFIQKRLRKEWQDFARAMGASPPR